MEEAAAVDEGLEFKWGKQKGIGGKKKDVRFYESFTFDGDEYRLYDCVLVADPSEPDSDELFVGKIIKIWEHTNKRAKHPRQVKLLWLFKPSEMPPGVVEGVPELLENELFLASGEGPGLASVNPLQFVGSALFCAFQRTKGIYNQQMRKSSQQTLYFAEHLMLEAVKSWIQ